MFRIGLRPNLRHFHLQHGSHLRGLATKAELQEFGTPRKKVAAQSRGDASGQAALFPFKSASPPQILINCLPNNIFIHVSTPPPTKSLLALNSGTAGFSGAAKTSQKAALAMLDILQRRLAELGIRQVRVNFRGLNKVRSVIVGQMRRMGLTVTEVLDTTGVPHNGCRPPKARRL